jgi:hypothetical protein
MGESEATLLAFWLPDLLFLAVGSLDCAGFCFYRSRFVSVALWFVAGAAAYAAFYCLAFAFLTDTGWLGVTLMLPATLWSGVFAVALSPAREIMFRESRPAQTSWILAKTFVQIAVVWCLILFVFPYFIVRLEDKLGIARLDFPFQKILAIVLFIAISFLGLSGAFLMSRFGAEYDAYRQNVRCWIPRLSPYQIEAIADSSNSIESPSGKM